MPLTCECDYGDDDEYAWYYTPPTDYATLGTRRRCRCSSCNELIDVGAVVAEFSRYRYAKDDVEEKIHDYNEIYLATYYLCERCADLWFSFRELGFECVSPGENMLELAKDYAATYGPKANPPPDQPGEGQRGD